MEPTQPISDWQYLRDPKNGINQTPVYLRTELTQEIQSVEEALKFLRNKRMEFVPSKRKGSVLVIWESPQIEIGRSPMGNDKNTDDQEIVSVLAAHGIQVRIDRS
ncbi:hypothetical protein [Hylemonella gracilis]|uniref:hypothetical protein n=1 Tax=Hylemonella gracilis TaxID=80880 RepID=UPI00103B4C18|nr:hypothetical protein [Hylemonella gracilis]